MKREFSNIYDNLYVDYVFNYNQSRRYYYEREEINFIRIIRGSIERSDRKQDLRSDAKYFLLVNFHQLVVLPVVEHNFYPIRDKEINSINLEEAIISDIDLIINESINSKKENDNQEEQVSGHQIMNTINEIWRNLKTTRIDIWG